VENKLVVDITKFKRDSYSLSFLYNVDLITKIKSLEKREWDSAKKCWVLDIFSLYQVILSYKGDDKIFFNFHQEGERDNFIKKYKKKLSEHNKKQEELKVSLAKQTKAIQRKKDLLALDKIEFDYSKYLNPGITPYRYQVAAAIFAHEVEKILIAADLGLGKTLITLLQCEMYEDSVKKVLVVVPNNLKFNWVNEVTKFTKQKAFVLETTPAKMKKNNKNSISESKYIICNYDYFKSGTFNFKERFAKHGLTQFDMLICDEAHTIKNPQANMVKNLLKHIRPIIGNKVSLLSATPQQNAITDLFVNLHLLSPLEFTSKSKFFTEWCGMKYDSSSFSGWSQISTPDYEKLHDKLEGLMIRLKKSEYLKDLPPLNIQKVYLEMSDEQLKTYQNIENGFAKIDWQEDKSIKGLENQKQVSVMGVMNELRQYTASIKLDYSTDLITELNNEGEKVILFDEYKNPLKKIHENFKNNSELYIGETDSYIRQELVDKFQQDSNELQNLFISFGAGNAGITLTKSSNIIANTIPYVPAILSQAIGRLDRIGQTNQVNAWILIVKDSIDEYVYDMITEKQKVISKVIDGEDFIDNANDNGSVISDLMKLYAKKFRN
jgi:SNF2 family DNA or RNA helicase